MTTIRNRINEVMGNRHYFRRFLRNELSRSSYYEQLMHDKSMLLNEGLNEDQIHLSARFPQDEEAIVDVILRDLVENGVLKTTYYPKDEFLSYREKVEEIFEHGVFDTYIFPEEARLLYALSQIYSPKNVVFLGSYYGYWAIWALPAIQKAGGHAWLLDVNAEVNAVCSRNMQAFGFQDCTTVLTEDAVEFMKSQTEEIDLAVIDPEGPVDHPNPDYRGKRLYYPLAQECSRLLQKNGIMICHNVIRRNLSQDWYFNKKIEEYKFEYEDFFPYVEQVFKLCVDYPTTEGVAIYSQVVSKQSGIPEKEPSKVSKSLSKRRTVKVGSTGINNSNDKYSDPKKVVLAYSGGLDTSVILPWLKERYPGVQTIAFVCDLGQGDDMQKLKEKATASGADEVVVRDCRKEFLEEYCFPMLRARAVYDEDYMLGTAVARPLIAKEQVLIAKESGADAVAHGATGKGNDQVRFELTYKALAPHLKIVAPWKDPCFSLNSREAALDYAKSHGVPVDATEKKIYSRDANLWHMSHEGGEIEDACLEPPDDCLVLSSPVSAAPDKAEYVTVNFEQGNPVSLNGKTLTAIELVTQLNELAGKHGVGQAVLVENRVVGLKSRGLYETPAGTVLYEAHKSLEQLCCERDLFHYKQQLSVKMAEMIYYGQWVHPLREALQAFIDHSNQIVTGKVQVKLYKGRAIAVACESPNSLYDPELASFSMGDYDVTAARGFIDLFGLPMQVRSSMQQSKATTTETV